MLSNRNDPGVEAKIREELRRNPGLLPVLEEIESASESFEVAAGSEGLDLAPAGLRSESANRCRMKLFRPRVGKERLCAFFYKRSNLAWSQDRFSYGGVEFLPGEIARAGVRPWIEWLASGFDPVRRPERLRRAFLYDIPD
jgi:hypothetical protein